MRIEQFAGAADERPAADVFLVAGRLADEHDAALRIAVGEDQLRRGGAQRAAFETFEQRAQLVEGLRASRGFARRHDRGLGRGRQRCVALPLRGRGRRGAGVRKRGEGFAPALGGIFAGDDSLGGRPYP